MARPENERGLVSSIESNYGSVHLPSHIIAIEKARVSFWGGRARPI